MGLFRSWQIEQGIENKRNLICLKMPEVGEGYRLRFKISFFGWNGVKWVAVHGNLSVFEYLGAVHDI